jgi:hypothetical protein
LFLIYSIWATTTITITITIIISKGVEPLQTLVSTLLNLSLNLLKLLDYISLYQMSISRARVVRKNWVLDQKWLWFHFHPLAESLNLFAIIDFHF